MKLGYDWVSVGRADVFGVNVFTLAKSVGQVSFSRLVEAGARSA